MKLRALIARIAVLCMLPVMAWAAYDATRVLDVAASRSSKVLEQARDLVALIERAARLDEPARLVAVNQFFNQRIAFHDDAETWGVPDYWASPLESLERRAGDCEDYAIAKYFALAASGVPVSRLRMVYVRARLAGQSQAHMVLAYYAEPNAEPEILDNLRPEVLPASRRPDLTPVFSFNTDGLWQGVGAQSQGDPLARLSLWRDLVAKVRGEGLF
jgi:predicted transglutaminase-like cysteine proteinase